MHQGTSRRTMAAKVIGLLLAVATPCQAQTAFQAHFSLQRTDDPTGGIVRGVMNYDPAGRRYRYDYPDRDYREIVRFDGEGAAARAWRYELGTHCESGCRATRLTHAMPLYAYDPSVYHPAGVDPGTGCSVFQAIDPFTTPVLELQLLPDGSPCSARWADGSLYRFENILTVDPSVPGLFEEPAECRNPERLDLLILIDRSASVSSERYEGARSRVVELLDRLTISPSQVNVALAHLDVGAELVLPFAEGTSRAAVQAALGSMTCTCGDTLDPLLKPKELGGSAAPTCCGRRTSLAAALEDASDLFTAVGRPDQPDVPLTTRRTVLVVTDGRSNTLRDGTTPCSGRTCRDDTAAALEELRQQHTSIDVQALRIRSKKLKPSTFTGRGTLRKADDVLAPLGTCSTAAWCDPATCHGLCECGECTAPSACEPSDNSCFVNTIVPGGRVCELVPFDCLTLPGFTRCDVPYCDPIDQACKKREYACPPSPQPDCMFRSCLPTTGECITDILPDPTCVDECESDAQCNDDNLCTIDRCVPTDTFRLCKFIPRTCDDGDPCTEDYCTDAFEGCQSRPWPSTYCDDGISCTVDFCVAGAGCTSTPLPCDDGQSCTTDVCDESSGYCSHRETPACPAGTTEALGACWTYSIYPANPSCEDMCAGIGLQYDPATETVAGSGGTDANCGFVVNAVLGGVGDFAYPSQSCSIGAGCFYAIPLLGQTGGGGRCAQPATDGSSTLWGFQGTRLCACR